MSSMPMPTSSAPVRGRTRGPGGRPRGPSGTARHQRGAVLVVGLIMLGVMSLLVASMIRTSILELRIGGANQAALETFANAESALLASIAANAGRWAPGFANLPAGAAGAPVPVAALVPVQNGTVDEPVIRQIACGNPAAGSSLAAVGQNNAVATLVFDITSTARSLLGGVQRLGAGVELLAPGGGC